MPSSSMVSPQDLTDLIVSAYVFPAAGLIMIVNLTYAFGCCRAVEGERDWRGSAVTFFLSLVFLLTTADQF